MLSYNEFTKKKILINGLSLKLSVYGYKLLINSKNYWWKQN